MSFLKSRQGQKTIFVKQAFKKVHVKKKKKELPNRVF